MKNYIIIHYTNADFFSDSTCYNVTLKDMRHLTPFSIYRLFPVYIYRNISNSNIKNGPLKI